MKRSWLRWPSEQSCLLSSGPLYPASLWSGLADDVVSCCGYGYDCYPMMGCPAYFQISNWETKDMGGRYSTDLRLIFVRFFSFIRPAHSGAHTSKKIQKILPQKSIFFCVSFLYFCCPIAIGLRTHSLILCSTARGSELRQPHAMPLSETRYKLVPLAC